MADVGFEQKLLSHSFKIIDSHAHLGSYSRFHIEQGGIEELIRQMDRIKVEKITISPMIGLQTDAKLANDITHECIKQYPSRVWGMATLNPNREGEVIDELERCFDTLGMTLIKLHPEESKCPMSRKVYEKVYAFAQERSLPILNHDWQSPERLAKLAETYPAVRFVQAHNGGNWDGKREDPYFDLARDHEHIYIDICASPIFYDALEKLVEYVGPKKILFGSDAPFLNLAFEVGKVILSNLSDDDKQLIFADNFLRMIGQE